MEEYTYNVLKKIKNNNLNFDWGETQILYSNVKVAKAFVEKIGKDHTLWKLKFDDFMNSPVFYEIKPLPENFLDNIAKWHIDNNILNSCFFGLLTSDEYVSSSFWGYLDSKLNDSNFKFDIPNITTMNERLLDLLLKHKRYNEISKIEIFSHIQRDLLKKLLDEYPFKDYPFPKFFEIYLKTNFKDITQEEKINYILSNKDRMSFACMLYLINNPISSNEIIKDILLEKIENESKMELPVDVDIVDLEKILSDHEKLSLYVHALKNNCVDILLRSKEDFSKSSIITSYIISLILSGSKVTDITNESLLNNNGVIEALVLKGYIKEASKSPLFEKYIDLIIRLINEKNINYTNYRSTFDYSRYLSITEAFVNNGELLYSREAISCIKDFKFLQEKILNDKDFCNNLETLPQEMCNNNEIIKELLKRKYYSNFFFIFKRNKDIKKVLKDNFELFKDNISADIAFATTLLQNYTSEVIMDTKLIAVYINLENPFMNTIINYIESHSEYFDAYSEELFNDIKITFAKQYKLNLSHLTKLEKLYGPSLIAFISLPNIHKIINLNDKQFELFCNLFPVEKSVKIKTIESEIYDAFKQLEFTTEEKDSILIFPNIKTSLQNSTEDYIELLKSLKEYFNESRFAVITKTFSKKYPILKEGIDATFKYILSNIENDIEIDKTMELLHELCNSYIKCKREEYRKSDKYDFNKDLKLRQVPEDRAYSSEYIKQMIQNGYILENGEKIQFASLIIRENDKLDNTLILDCLNYYLYGKNYSEFTNELKLINSNMKNLLLLINRCVEKYSELLNKYEIDKLASAQCKKRNGYFSSNENEFLLICKLLNINPNKLGNRDLFISTINSTDLISLFNLMIKRNSEYVLSKIDELKLKKGISTQEELVLYFEEKLKNYRFYNLYLMFSVMDIDLIKENILNSKINNEIMKKKNIETDKDYLFESLKHTISKYHLHLLPEELNNLLHKECFNMSCNVSDIASFVTYYYKIYEIELDNAINKAIKEEKEKLIRNGNNTNQINEEEIILQTIKKFTLPIVDVFKQTDVYSSSSNVYSIILGPKDYMYLKTNPSPLPAKHKLKNDGRLKEAIRWTIENFKRREVTIPTFNNIFESNGKKMRIIVGNFTAPYNLTHGERNRSCMRIGGEGETFFDFCLSNKTAFHITFESPSGEYVSRVSGFRNGNTVFLNELRESCLREKYSNEDIVNFTRKLSEQLIELSKDSSCPIDNVVITRSYATKDVPDEDVKLNVSDIKEGIGAFYSDINQNCIVLATNSKTEKFTPVNLDNSNVPIYPVGRETIRTGTSEEIIAQINRVHAIKERIEKKLPIGKVESIVSDVKAAAVGGDWFVYLDYSNRLHWEAINIHPEAIKEMNMAKTMLFSNLVNSEEVKLCI